MVALEELGPETKEGIARCCDCLRIHGEQEFESLFKTLFPNKGGDNRMKITLWLRNAEERGLIMYVRSRHHYKLKKRDREYNPSQRELFD